MKKILLISDSSYPDGTAYATRIKSFCRIFKELNYDVEVLVYVVPGHEPGEQLQDDLCRYSSVGRDTSIKSQIVNYIMLPQILEKKIKQDKIEMLFAGGCSVEYSQIFKVSKKYQLPLIVDANEWYHYSIFTLGFLDYRYWLHQRAIKSGYMKAYGIVTTSELFDRHYNGKNTFRIPSMFDVLSQDCCLNASKLTSIRLAYAGNPGRRKKPKETFSALINGIYMAKMHGLEIEFDIFGANKETIERNLDTDDLATLDKLKSEIRFKGKVSHEVVMREYQDSDYSVFIRPQRRSSNAGFPTKLVESFIAGTPVISNDTGDISAYLIDGYNGFLTGNTPDAICGVLLRIAVMSIEERSEMRRNARICAEKSFDYRVYIDGMKRLMQRKDGV